MRSAKAGGETRDNPVVKRKGEPRRPSRRSGIVRFNALLDATERLLNVHDPDDIGLYQIAEAAAASTASVYHFFPTKDAAFLALAQRYHAAYLDIMAEPVNAVELRSWQDILAIDQQLARDFCNSHPSAMKIFYGIHGSSEPCSADSRFTADFAKSVYSRMDSVFHMPFVRDVEIKFYVASTISDAINGISYRRHGFITNEFFTEGLAASTAYCELFLPKRVEPRECLLQAASAGKRINLGYVEDTCEMSSQARFLEKGPAS